MFSQLRTATIIICLHCVSGCASSYKKSLTHQFMESDQTVHVSSIILQKEIDAQIVVQNSSAVGAQFGAVGAIISGLADNSVNSRSRRSVTKQIAPLRNSLADFEFNPRFHQVIADVAQKLSWLETTEIAKVNDASQLQFIRGNYYLKFITNYSLSSDFRALLVTTNVALEKMTKPRIARNGKEIEQFDLIYQNRYRYVSPVQPKIIKSRLLVQEQKAALLKWYKKELAKTERIDERKSLKFRSNKKMKAITDDYSFEEANLEMAKYWARDDGNLIKKYLNESMGLIAKMILIDISDTRETSEIKRNKSIEKTESGMQLLQEDKFRVILRDLDSSMDGQLCTLTKGTLMAYCTYL